MERMSLDFNGKVAVLKFNHPEVMNAVGGLMLEDFAEARELLTPTGPMLIMFKEI